MQANKYWQSVINNNENFIPIITAFEFKYILPSYFVANIYSQTYIANMLFERLLKIIKANLAAQERKSPQDHSTSSGYTHYKQKETYTNSPPPSDSKEKVYYDALEISPPATFDQIKMAYKKLVKKYHPDLFNNDPQKREYAEIVTQKINEAYAYFENKAEK